MIDNEIIKALDILDKFDFFQGQRAGRELWSEKPFDIQEEDVKSFSADVKFLKEFINRQREEIERYKEYYATMEIEIYSFRKDQAEVKFLKNKIRAEAIKEFAERLKGVFHEMYFKYEYGNFCEIFDNLVKEMTEEQK